MGTYAKPRTTSKASVTRKARVPQKSRARQAKLALFVSKDELPGFRDGLHCDSCGRRALSSTSKLQHRRLHYADDAPGADLFKRPHRCDWCGKGFPQKGSLTRHIASQHDKSLMAPCSTCGQRFADRARLHCHRVSEHGHVPKKRRKDDRRLDGESHAEEREEDADSEEDPHEDAAGDWNDDVDGDMDAEGDVDDEVALAEKQLSPSLMPQRGSPAIPTNNDLARLSAPPLDFQVIDTAPVEHFSAPAQYVLGSAIFASVNATNFAQYHLDTTFSNPFMPGSNNASLPTFHEAINPGDTWTLPQSRMYPSLATRLNTDLPSSANPSTLTSSSTTPLTTPPPPHFSPFVDLDQATWNVGLGESTALGDFATAPFDDLDLLALAGFDAYTADGHASSWDHSGLRVPSAIEDTYAFDTRNLGDAMMRHEQ